MRLGIRVRLALQRVLGHCLHCHEVLLDEGALLDGQGGDVLDEPVLLGEGDEQGVVLEHRLVAEHLDRHWEECLHQFGGHWDEQFHVPCAVVLNHGDDLRDDEQDVVQYRVEDVERFRHFYLGQPLRQDGVLLSPPDLRA